jgi:tetratricopeptide (TPR) repeat protein
MQKILLFGALLVIASIGRATTIDESLQNVEASWAKIYYSVSENQQSSRYRALLKRVESLAESNPNRAEPLIWQAIIIATNAEQQSSFNALNAIQLAHNLLLKAIKIKPTAMQGSAFVTLGSLYNMVPGWPIAFGDDEKARQSLQMALKINPDGIDSNYFYGEYLLSKNQNQAAAIYFKKAVLAPTRPEQFFADTQLKAEAQLGLDNANARKISGIKNFFTNLFYFATAAASEQ